MKNNILIFIIIGLIGFGCCEIPNKNYLIIDKSLSNLEYDTVISRSTNLDLKNGINFNKEIFFNSSDTITYSNPFPCEAYKCNDSLFIVFYVKDGIIDVTIYKDSYDVSIKFYDDYDSYPDGEGNRSEYIPDICFNSLKFKYENFNIGDTLQGSLMIATEPYDYKILKDNKECTNYYNFYFFIKITSKEDQVPRTLPV